MGSSKLRRIKEIIGFSNGMKQEFTGAGDCFGKRKKLQNEEKRGKMNKREEERKGRRILTQDQGEKSAQKMVQKDDNQRLIADLKIRIQQQESQIDHLRKQNEMLQNFVKPIGRM